MTRAVIIVDVQNDFCEGGSLAVAGGARVAAAIGPWLEASAPDHVVATRDHHIDPGAHFAQHPDFVDSWPVHCVVGTGGVELHPALDRSRIEAVFDKGEFQAAYSGFEAVTSSEALPGFASSGDDGAGIDLATWLRARDVTTVDVVGVATDHCVRATALDAARYGFATTVQLDLTAGVARATVDSALAQLRDAGIRLVGDPIVQS